MLERALSNMHHVRKIQRSNHELYLTPLVLELSFSSLSHNFSSISINAAELVDFVLIFNFLS